MLEEKTAPTFEDRSELPEASSKLRAKWLNPRPKGARSQLKNWLTSMKLAIARCKLGLKP